MRFVQLSPHRIEVRRGEVPRLREGEALIRVLACGVCGSDVHLYEGAVLPKGVSYPLRPGHEVAGIIEELAEGAAADGVARGDMVALHLLDPCGRCSQCRSGHEERCRDARMLGFGAPGGMAEAVVWPVRRLVPVRGLAPQAVALLSDAAATAHHAFMRADVPPGGRVCVIGAGGVGTHVLLLARTLDPSVRLVAVVRSEASAERVRALGADAMVGIEGAATRVRERVGAVDAVVDFSGAATAAAEGLRMLERGGRLVLGSVDDAPLDLATSATTVATRELSVVGTYASTIEDLRAVVALAQSGALDVSASATHRLPLDGAAEAFRLARERPPGMVRVVLEPG